MTTLTTGTRDEILKLLSKQELTVAELAAKLELTPAAVRQHVAPLEALGWVEHHREVKGAHRPSHRYRLTGEGQNAFPKRYDLLLGEVLEVLLARQGTEQVQWVVQQAARRLADRVKKDVSDIDPARLWKRVTAWLETEMAWKADATAAPDGGHQFVIHQCPFRDVSQAHPELCGAFFTTLIGELTGQPPGYHAPAGEGPACCSIVMNPAPRR